MTCLKKKFSSLYILNGEELGALNRIRSVAHFKKGECIIKQGMRPKNLICLSSGKVKMITTCENGKDQIVNLKKPVDFIGFSELMSDQPYMASAIALEDISVCLIEKEDFTSVLYANKEFSKRIIGYLAYELVRLRQRLEKLAQQQMRARLVDTLLFLHEVYGTSKKDQFIDVDLKHRDLAALSNMNIENVSRNLAALSQSGLIELYKKRIKLLDLKYFKKLGLAHFN